MLPNFFRSRLSVHVQLLLLLCLTVGCIAGSDLLLRQQAAMVSQLRATVLPTAAQLPALEHRIDILKQQVDTADMERELSGGVTEESERAFVVPATVDRVRLLKTIDVLFGALQQQKEAQALSAITIGDATALASPSPEFSLRQVPVTFTMQTTAQGATDLLSVLHFAGSVTVGDLLSPQDTQLLLSLTEQENPAAITGLEEFFDTDLLSYLQDPSMADNQLLKSFTSPSFETALQAATSSDDFREARRVFSGSIGQTLAQQQLWPLPLLSIEKLSEQTQQDGSMELTVRLTTVIRDGDPTASSGATL